VSQNRAAVHGHKLLKNPVRSGPVCATTSGRPEELAPPHGPAPSSMTLNPISMTASVALQEQPDRPASR
jgi:hypothetical protein